jgi:hypothetical protein
MKYYALKMSHGKCHIKADGYVEPNIDNRISSLNERLIGVLLEFSG